VTLGLGKTVTTSVKETHDVSVEKAVAVNVTMDGDVTVTKLRLVKGGFVRVSVTGDGVAVSVAVDKIVTVIKLKLVRGVSANVTVTVDGSAVVQEVMVTTSVGEGWADEEGDFVAVGGGDDDGTVVVLTVAGTGVYGWETAELDVAGAGAGCQPGTAVAMKHEQALLS